MYVSRLVQVYYTNSGTNTSCVQIPYASFRFFKLTAPCNESRPEIEFLALGGSIRLGLRRLLVLLLDLDLNGSRSDLDDWEEAEEARWRCIRVGSMLGMFARRAKIERTKVGGQILCG